MATKKGGAIYLDGAAVFIASRVRRKSAELARKNYQRRLAATVAHLKAGCRSSLSSR